MARTPDRCSLADYLGSEKLLCPAPLQDCVLRTYARLKALHCCNTYAEIIGFSLLLLLAAAGLWSTLLPDRPNRDDACDRAFSARPRADRVPSGAQLAGLSAAIIKALVKTQRRAFARQKQPIPPAVLHRQFDGAVTEQLCAGQAIDRNAAIAPGAGRKWPRRHRNTGRDGNACPGCLGSRRQVGGRWWSSRRAECRSPIGQRKGADRPGDRSAQAGIMKQHC